MSTTLTQGCVPAFRSIEVFREATALKGQGADIDLYPRDGTRTQFAVESKIAELTDNDPSHVFLQNTGMNAVRSALDVAVEHVDAEKPLIALAGELYAKSSVTIQKYAKRYGFQTTIFDSGDRRDIDDVFELGADIIFSETVSNGPNVPVLDHKYLLEKSRSAKHKPVVILDHTLPLSTGYNVFGDTDESDRLIVVESGTKGYSLNADMAGLTFMKNPDFIAALHDIRCNEGGVAGVATTELIRTLLPDTKADFDARNQRVYEHTAKLAIALFALEFEKDANFEVRHPALGTHRNFDEASQYSDGRITPVFYIRSKKVDQDAFAQRLLDHPHISRHADIGQSFGFNETRIMPEKNGPFVRIAGGADTDTDALSAILSEAIIEKVH